VNINSYLLPIGGAVLGYLVGDKDTAVRNAVVGAGVGFAANYFMKPSLPMLQEDLPPQNGLGPNDDPGTSSMLLSAEEGGPGHVEPNDPQQPSPNGDPDYISDSGENSDWIGLDPFPVGAMARFGTPLQTSNSVVANVAIKTEMGHWVTHPGQEMYWSSVGRMARDGRVDVVDIVDQTLSTVFWSPSDAQALATYP
jgi:hypothetical protein